jgi:hypothetical protein
LEQFASVALGHVGLQNEETVMKEAGSILWQVIAKIK